MTPARSIGGALRIPAFAVLGLYALLTSVGLANDVLGARGQHAITGALLLIAALVCALAAPARPGERAAWAAACVGLVSWSCGELLVARGAASSSGLGPADLLSLGFYPCAAVALVLLVRARLRAFSTTLWLDGLAGALSMAALAAAFLFPPVLAGHHGDTVAFLAFPASDLLLIACVVFGLAATGWRPGAALLGLSAACALVAVTDATSLWWSATGHASASMAWAWLWPAAAIAMAELAWRAPGVQRSAGEPTLRLLLVPLGFSLTALGLLASGLVHALNIAGYQLAVGALMIIVLRLALTVLDNLQIAESSRREAVTDALTGLGNRRRLMADVEAALGGRRETLLILFDLDGFKLYNDTFGHPAGDALLSRLGAALRGAAAPFGAAYRLGGDEFCVLARLEAITPERAIEVSIAALSEHGAGFSVTPSQGSVALPRETTDLTLAFQTADQRLYLQKGDRRRSRDSSQVRDVLLQALRERQPDLDEHVGGVSALARGVARQLGLDAEGIDEVVRGAELHDIGKMAIPDAIIDKPAALDGDEQQLIRQHSLIGERILSVAPALRAVGTLVRSSHERWDGHGYPDGLAGEDIPIGARIIAVCDAYDAMRSDRPYSAPMSEQDALEELQACAGGQFDPRVVAAFCAYLRAAATDATSAVAAP